MVDWDYGFSCPECGEEYVLDYDFDGKNETKFTCEKCGEAFTVKAIASVDITVEIKE